MNSYNIFLRPCPMPYALCPMPYALCPYRIYQQLTGLDITHLTLTIVC
ncbi:MAG: hypothetical protein WBL95_18025 [Microcoleus sp.]